MHRGRTRTLTAWIAVLAFLVSAFAPALAQAFASNDATPWAELCSVHAPASSQGPAKDPARGAAHPLEHCPACALHLDAFAVPPAAPTLLLAPLGADAEPAAFLHAPHTLHAWRQAQPRGPPLPV